MGPIVQMHFEHVHGSSPGMSNTHVSGYSQARHTRCVFHVSVDLWVGSVCLQVRAFVCLEFVQQDPWPVPACALAPVPVPG